MKGYIILIKIKIYLLPLTLFHSSLSNGRQPPLSGLGELCESYLLTRTA